MQCRKELIKVLRWVSCALPLLCQARQGFLPGWFAMSGLSLGLCSSLGPDTHPAGVRLNLGCCWKSCCTDWLFSFGFFFWEVRNQVTSVQWKIEMALQVFSQGRYGKWMNACKKGDSGTQDDWGGEEGGVGCLGWIAVERDKLTGQELPATCGQGRGAFLSPSLLGCLNPLLVPSPKWSWLESSVWDGAWRISSLWVGFCLNYFLLLHYICSELWRKSLPFLCLSGGMQDRCCPSAAALSSTFCVCLATCLATVVRNNRHHMNRAVGLGGDAHEWAGPGGLDVNTVAGRGGCRTSSEVLL